MHSNAKIKNILAILTLLAIISFLFRGSLDYGLEFDEVFRVNNLLPLFNSTAYPYDQSIFNIRLFGVSIPLMYKTYISSTYIVQFLPILFFDNYLVGLRFLEFFYFFMSIAGFFLIVSRYNFLFAFCSSLLIATSPLFYPDIRNGFAYSWHIFFVPLSIHLFYKYFNESQKPVILFFAVFFLFFSANLVFYSSWAVAALILSSLIFFKKYWISVLSSFKNIIVILFGVLLGLVNYIIYNINSGFPTLKPIFLKIFNPSEYNKNPIDYKRTKPFINELSIKFKILFSFLEDYHYLYIAITLIIIIIFIIGLYKIIRLNKLKEYQLYFFPLFVFLLVMLFILVSPNTTRAGHYVYLIPFYEVTILSALILTYRLFGIYKPVRIIVFAIPILMLGTNLAISNAKIREANKTNGTGYFSPAIYDLKTYIDGNDIDYNDIVHIQWGLYSQLYFLNKGKARINSIVFDLLDTASEKEKFQIFQIFFLYPENVSRESLYFPIYPNYNKDITEAFNKFILLNGGNLRKINTFYEKSGAEIFSLFKLENLKELRKNVHLSESIRISDKLQIVDFGPKYKNSIKLKDFGMWVKTVGHSKDTKIMINDIPLKTVYYETHLTTSVPEKLVSQKGVYMVQIVDIDKNIKSNPVLFEIR